MILKKISGVIDAGWINVVGNFVDSFWNKIFGPNQL